MDESSTIIPCTWRIRIVSIEVFFGAAHSFDPSVNTTMESCNTRNKLFNQGSLFNTLKSVNYHNLLLKMWFAS